jgi:hypothetical protein
MAKQRGRKKGKKGRKKGRKGKGLSSGVMKRAISLAKKHFKVKKLKTKEQRRWMMKKAWALK